MRTNFKMIGKGNYKIIKYSKEKELVFCYKDEIVKKEVMDKDARHYSNKSLIILLNKFINQHKKEL